MPYPTHTLRRIARALLLIALAVAPLAASAQANAVAIAKARLTAEEQSGAAGLRFNPTDRALAWVTPDTVLVSHLEAYTSGLAFAVNCRGSGFFKVPINGGAAMPAAPPFCELQKNPTAAPDGASIVFFNDPTYARVGSSILRIADAALLQAHLASQAIDTLQIHCGTGYKDAAISSTGRVAWTGACRDSADIARDPKCAAVNGKRPSGCSADDGDGIFVAQARGGAAQRIGGPDGVDAHEPAWSRDGASLAFSVGENSLGGRWEVSRTRPGDLMILDARGVRSLGQGESASWSPDGAWIATFADDQDDANERYGGPRIYLIHPDGSGRKKVFMNELISTYPEYMGAMPFDVRDGKAFGPLIWSPDGKWLAFARQFEAGASVWRLELETGRIQPVTQPDQ